MSHTFKIAAALVLATAIIAPAAAAQAARQPASIKVSHADLDLSAKAGAETLLRRMKSATARICGERPSPKQIQATVRHTACTREAMTAAVAALDISTVTALFHGRAETEVAGR